MSDVPQRLRWFSELLTTQSTEHILEIGCGNGMLLELLARRHPHATLVGIDRSELQVRKATQRLARLPAPPRVYHLALEEADVQFATHPFARILAMNVNLAWTNPVATGTALRALMAPRGRALLGYEPPTSSGVPVLEARLARAATAAGFIQGALHYDRASSAFAVEWHRPARRARAR